VRDRRPIARALKLAEDACEFFGARHKCTGARYRSVAVVADRAFGPRIPELSSPAVESAAIRARAAFSRSTLRDRGRSPDGVLRGTPHKRSRFLLVLARLLSGERDALLALASRETGLTRLALSPEFDRMIVTLSTFASMAWDGGWTRPAIHTAQAAGRDNSGAAGQDVRRMLCPLGVVAVFEPSNFPFAYGAAGGDVASAIAAGCPVVVKGHPAHPLTSLVIAHAASEALHRLGMHSGWHSVLATSAQSADRVGAELAASAHIAAIGFTGSHSGGMALDRIARERAEPIPVFAEMGSTNPVIVFPHALHARRREVLEQLARSILARNGQQCTCPGVVLLPGTHDSRKFAEELATLLAARRPRPMLSARVLRAYQRATWNVRKHAGVELIERAAKERELAGTRTRVRERPPRAGCAEPIVLHSTFATCRSERAWREEMFGPAVLVIGGPWADESPHDAANAVLLRFAGSLTATLIRDASDDRRVRDFLQCMPRAGRIIVNSVPTGVRVCEAMVHGGPYPATNAPHTTAVGPMAIERWCRPVCWQNCPDALLPEELRDANPRGIERVVNGVRTRAPVRRV
jgi:NADP-dependent aldehyde dehydrogenase